jgi:hypothetical protein
LNEVVHSSESGMRAYVIATGVVFGLITLAHVWRIVVEPRLATEPWFLLTTIVSAALCVGAWRVMRRSKAS